MKQALASLPKTLNDTYARILHNIPDHFRPSMTRILQFLIFTERFLRIEEIVDIVAVNPANRPRFDPKDGMPVPKEVSRYCSSLVVVVTREAEVEDNEDEDGYERTIITHFSVKAYLVSNQLEEIIATALKEITAKASMAEICLTYLLELDLNSNKYVRPLEEITKSYWLAKYSARYWTDFAVITESCSDAVSTLAMELLLSRQAFEICCRIFSPDERWRKSGAEIPPALYYASFAGLTRSVLTLLANGVDINAQGGHVGFALHAASYKGHEEFVKLLLGNRANANAEGGLYGTPLQTAAHDGHETTVKILLDAGVDVNNQSAIYGNTLLSASDQNHETIM